MRSGTPSTCGSGAGRSKAEDDRIARRQRRLDSHQAQPHDRAGRRQRQPQHRQRRDARARRRVGLRQVDASACRSCGLLPNGGHIIGGRSSSRAASSSACRIAELRKIRGNEIAMIFQDSHVLAEPDEDRSAIRSPNPFASTAERTTRRRSIARSRCLSSSACRTPRSGSTTTRTSSPAACASG